MSFIHFVDISVPHAVAAAILYLFAVIGLVHSLTVASRVTRIMVKAVKKEWCALLNEIRKWPKIWTKKPPRCSRIARRRACRSADDSGVSAPKPDFMTPSEYLAIERKAEIKSEYVGGRMYAMSAASDQHNLIAGSLYAEIYFRMRDRPCRVQMSDMRVKVSPTGMYAYPDIAAFRGKAEFEDGYGDTLLNPSVIIEVLSDSTEAYDRGEKFAHYRRLESLREYVLVSQKKVRIEHYRREGDEWILSEISDPSGTLDLPSIGCRVNVAAIYVNAEITPPASPASESRDA